MSSTTRISQACLRCRAKKRRCDGQRPVCQLCARLRVTCQYPDYNGRSGPRIDTAASASATQRPSTRPTISPRDSKDTVHRDGKSLSPSEHQAVVDNTSGVMSAALVTAHVQGRRSSFQRAGLLQIAPWNLGLGYGTDASSLSTGVCNEQPANEIIEWRTFEAYAKAFFADVHPIFGSFSEKDFWTGARSSWMSSSRHSVCQEARLSFVAALGALFSRAPAQSTALFKHAERHMAAHLVGEQVHMMDIDSLILRPLYLRLTVSPHASWLSSWTTMGAVQAVMTVSTEHPTSQTYREERNTANAAELERRRRFLIAQLLNAWICNESARPRPLTAETITLAGTVKEWTPPKSPSWDLLHLYDASENLDPRRAELDGETLEKLLLRVCEFETDHDVVILSKANLAIVIFRRWRLSSKTSGITADLTAHLCTVGVLGLNAVRQLAQQYKPWHHVANLPFQVLCTLLLLDTRESLALVGSAVATLRMVGDIFDTPATRASIEIATQLVSLAQKRKQEDSLGLSSAIQISDHSVPPPSQSTDGPVPFASGPTYQSTVDQDEPMNDPGNILPDWDDIDWDAMLSGESDLWGAVMP